MENTTITIGDLGSIRNIIDLAATRGAFKAAEMASIGEVYDKLGQFIEAVSKQAQEENSSDQTQGEAQ